jgi:hemin uptake protein HemP
MAEPSDRPTAAPTPQAEPEPPVLAAADLLRGRREVVIEHDGVRYRLRLTRRNRLILQK